MLYALTSSVLIITEAIAIICRKKNFYNSYIH